MHTPGRMTRHSYTAVCKVHFPRRSHEVDINRPMSKSEGLAFPNGKQYSFFRSKLTLPEGEGPASRSKL